MLTDGRTTDAGVTGILIAHLGAFGSGELIKPDFPSLADEIAEPHPDMNIKVAAFTVSEKSSNFTSASAVSFTVLSQTPHRPSYFQNSIIA